MAASFHCNSELEAYKALQYLRMDSLVTGIAVEYAYILASEWAELKGVQGLISIDSIYTWPLRPPLFWDMYTGPYAGGEGEFRGSSKPLFPGHALKKTVKQNSRKFHLTPATNFTWTSLQCATKLATLITTQSSDRWDCADEVPLPHDSMYMYVHFRLQRIFQQDL